MHPERAQPLPEEPASEPLVPLEDWDKLAAAQPANVPPESGVREIVAAPESMEMTAPSPMPEGGLLKKFGEEQAAQSESRVIARIERNAREDAKIEHFQEVLRENGGDLDKTIDAVIAAATGPNDMFALSEAFSGALDDAQQARLTQEAVRLLHAQFPSTTPKEEMPPSNMAEYLRGDEPKPKKRGFFERLFGKE